MSSIQVRGYAVLNAAAYLRSKGESKNVSQLFQGFSPALQESLKTASPVSWIPIAQLAELYHAVASLGNSEEQARDELIECGRYVASEATNTYLRLAMRLLTPALFAKKLPSFWSRDCSGGRYVVDVVDDKKGMMRCHLEDMPGFDHIGPIAAGYLMFALESMGKVVKSTELHGWSRATPWTEGVSFAVHWR